MSDDDDHNKTPVFWNRQFTQEFLELYKYHEALWRVKSKSYSDKYQKDAAYRILVKKVKEINPNATRDDVVKKINNYRSSFRKEVKKTRKAEAAGRKYVSRLWYFDLLSFVLDQDAGDGEPGDAQYMMYETYKPDEDTMKFESQIVVKEEQLQEPTPQLPQLKKYGLSVQEVNHLLPNSAFDQYSLESSEMPSLKKRLITNEEFQETSTQVIVSNQLHHSEPVAEDEFDIQAKLWAADLRKMNLDQQLYAKKAICDILFEGQLGTLHRHSVTINAPRTS